MDTKFAVFTGVKFYYFDSLAEIAKTFTRNDLDHRSHKVEVLAGAVVVGELDMAKLLDELYGPVDAEAIKCPACGGRTKAVDNMPGVERMCIVCGGLMLYVNHTDEIATEWCCCDTPENEIYYWREEAEVRHGAHGWLCGKCHGISQTG